MVWREEAPKSMVRGRIAFLKRLGRNRRGQWVFRHSKSEPGSGTVNSGYTTRLVQITVLGVILGGRCGGRKVRALDRQPVQGEMERGRKVWRGQFRQRERPGLANQSRNRLTVHGGHNGGLVWTNTVGGCDPFLGFWRTPTFPRLGHVIQRPSQQPLQAYIRLELGIVVLLGI
jgi:hypothetical protein